MVFSSLCLPHDRCLCLEHMNHMDYARLISSSFLSLMWCPASSLCSCFGLWYCFHWPVLSLCWRWHYCLPGLPSWKLWPLFLLLFTPFGTSSLICYSLFFLACRVSSMFLQSILEKNKPLCLPLLFNQIL